MTRKKPKPDETSGYEAIERAAAKLHPNPEPDEATAKGIEDAKKDQRTYVGQELKFRELRNEQTELDIKHQRAYAWSIGILLPVWLITVFGLVIMKAFKVADFDLSDKVLMVLIGTTTANVIGLYAIIAKYLFSSKKRK